MVGVYMNAYSGFAGVYDLLMDDFDYPRWADYYVELVRRAGGNPKRMAECGCGTGSMWQGMCLPDGCRLTLTGFSAGMLDTARANTAHLQADYALVDAQDIPYPDAAFDVVIANMMLYHVPDIVKALREIRRVLKPGGTFIASGIIEGRQDEVRAAIEKNGFTVIKHFNEDDWHCFVSI